MIVGLGGPYELGLRLGIRSGHQPLSTRLAELCSESTAGGFAKACAVALALGLAASGEVIVAPPWASPEEDAVAAGERRNLREWGATIVVEKNHGGAYLIEVLGQVLRHRGPGRRV